MQSILNESLSLEEAKRNELASQEFKFLETEEMLYELFD